MTHVAPPKPSLQTAAQLVTAADLRDLDCPGCTPGLIGAGHRPDCAARAARQVAEACLDWLQTELELDHYTRDVERAAPK